MQLTLELITGTRPAFIAIIMMQLKLQKSIDAAWPPDPTWSRSRSLRVRDFRGTIQLLYRRLVRSSPAGFELEGITVNLKAQTNGNNTFYW